MQRLVAGVAAQYESTVLYHQVREDLEKEGVLFLDTDSGLREHEELFRPRGIADRVVPRTPSPRLFGV